METTTTIKNPISGGEFFLWGTKEDEKVMENKSTICVDRLAARIILHSPQEQCDKEIILPSNNSFHSLPPTTKISHIMRTRKNNNTQGRNTMQDKPLTVETFVWPKFSPRLSLREKEEDFLAIKGSKLPMKPKKRLKRIRNAIDDVCPGFWLGTVSEERYEVRENKYTKKRARGLKAIQGVGSDLA